MRKIKHKVPFKVGDILKGVDTPFNNNPYSMTCTDSIVKVIYIRKNKRDSNFIFFHDDIQVVLVEDEEKAEKNDYDSPTAYSVESKYFQLIEEQDEDNQI